MLNVGPTELLVILVLALIVFGPKKLPEVGRSLGRGLREFRRASDEIKGEIQRGLSLDAEADEDHDDDIDDDDDDAHNSAAVATPSVTTVQALSSENGQGPAEGSSSSGEIPGEHESAG